MNRDQRHWVAFTIIGLIVSSLIIGVGIFEGLSFLEVLFELVAGVSVISALMQATMMLIIWADEGKVKWRWWE